MSLWPANIHGYKVKVQSEAISASHLSSQPVMVTGWLVSGIVYDIHRCHVCASDIGSMIAYMVSDIIWYRNHYKLQPYETGRLTTNKQPSELKRQHRGFEPGLSRILQLIYCTPQIWKKIKLSDPFPCNLWSISVTPETTWQSDTLGDGIKADHSVSANRFTNVLKGGWP